MNLVNAKRRANAPLKRYDSPNQTRITFNCSYNDKDRWWKLAHENGLTLSELIRIGLTQLEEDFNVE